MKRLLSVVIMVTMLMALLAGCGGSKPAPASSAPASSAPASSAPAAPAAQQIVLKYGEITADGNPMGASADLFAKTVAELSKGRIKVDVYKSGKLGDGPASFQALQMGGGAIDIYRGNTNELKEYRGDKINVFGLPFVFRDREHLWKVIESPLGDEMKNDMQVAKTGMVGLFYLDEGARYVFTRKPVKDIAGLKGLKIRVPQTDLMMKTMKAIGASPTPMAYSELYTALQTGTVDGAENPYGGYQSNKFYEVAPNLLLTNHTYSPSIVLMSEKSWAKLSKEDQEIIMKAGKMVEADNKKNAAALDEKIVGELKAKGVVITKIDIAPLAEACKSVVEEYAGKNMELYKKVIAIK